MALDRNHDVEEVPCRYESRAVRILGPEGHVSIFLVKVVQELRELGVGDVPSLLAAKVQLAKVGIEGKGEALVQGRLLDDLGELICSEEDNHEYAVHTVQSLITQMN